MALLGALVLPIVSCSDRTTDIFKTCDGVRATDKALIVLRDSSSVTVTTRALRSGVCFDGKWDFSDCRALRVTVENKDSVDWMSLYVYMENDSVDWNTPAQGVWEARGRVAPLSRTTLEFDLPCEMPHPEVDKYFYLMKTSPYNEFKHFCYNVDLKDVRRVKIRSYRTNPGSQWEISGLALVRGKRAETPDYMLLDSAAFFPCYDRYGQFKHREWPGKTHSDADLQKALENETADLAANPGPEDWDRFGGWAAGPRYEATGHFRVEKIDGKWWMIDPDGYLYWSHGIVRVNPSCAVTPLHGKNLPSRNLLFEDLPKPGDPLYQFRFTNDALLVPYYEKRQEDSTYDFSSANIYRKYGEDHRKIWADLAHRRLRSWGVNTIANSSDIDICRMDRTPYTDRFDIRSKPIEGADGPWFPIMDPFDPSFKAAIEKELKDHKRDIEDPWLLGYFVDNEIKWGDSTHAAKCVVAAPENQAAKKAMRQWLRKKYGRSVDPSAATEEDLKAFNMLIIEEYYKVIRRAFDEYAPGVLYMGCRFAGFLASNEDVVTIGARYCDVISHNQYRYHLRSFHLPEGVDKPVMVGEWHLGALDRGMCHPSLIKCKDQQERGHFYEEYATSALRHPNVIGIHWHQFMDQAGSGRFDGENLHVGFLDCCDTPYPETIAAARKVGAHMYETRFNN